MKQLAIILLSICLVALSSCATLFSGTKATITVIDDKVKDPVDLTIDAVTYPDIYLPAKVKVNRGREVSKITAESEHYGPSTIDIYKKFNSTSLFNILIGGIPGFIVDFATGSLMKPQQKVYNLNMKPRKYVEDPTIVAREATNTVSRDTPGQTELERTIIRWYFDSDPRGARIFWRVVSSIPAVVKNTNESYLMTTPFEETRAFNILGLTYENSRDVQIEIKVSKKGYEDQIKRFNVRQAIDQQEISAFFELVKQ